MDVTEGIKRMKAVAPELAASTHELRERALELIADALRAQKDTIFAANARDLEAASKAGVAASTQKRLVFNEHKLEDSLAQLTSLIGLEDPIGKIAFTRELDHDLILKRVSCPIGVIGVIFEARPDALIQISALCIKSGNCAILKGGKETTHTNRALFQLIAAAVVEAGLPQAAYLQVETHADIDELLKLDGYVDLLIPRGSNAFVSHIMQNTKIPVMGHSSGICHIYVDSEADLELALPIIVDAKTQYPVACNAVETVLVNREVADVFYPMLAKSLSEAKVKLRATSEVVELLGDSLGSLELESIADDDFATEYGDFTLATKIVDSLEAAIEHINYYGSHHTDCIITKNDSTARYFMQRVDSAGVYKNVSTRFADGFRYGFGAEVGISTGKLHARGPVGLEGMMSYKYELHGAGQIVADYAEGRSHFTHIDL